jgi:hypothetical protein
MSIDTTSVLSPAQTDRPGAEISPSSISAFVASLGLPANSTAAVAAPNVPVSLRPGDAFAQLSRNSDWNSELLQSLVPSTTNPADRRIGQDLLIRQLQNPQQHQQQQQILAPAIDMMLERMVGTTSRYRALLPEQQQQRPPPMGDTMSLHDRSSTLLNLLRGSTNMNFNTSVLQQYVPMDSAIIEALVRQNNVQNVAATLRQPTAFPTAREYSELNLAPENFLDLAQQQQQHLIQSLLDQRRRENAVLSLNAQYTTQSIPDEVLLALLSRQSNLQPPPNQERQPDRS